MRIASLLLLSACSGGLRTIGVLDNEAPLGVGLTQRYGVSQDGCTQDFFSCDPDEVDFAISVQSGSGVEVVDDVPGNWFELTGIIPDKTTLLLDAGDDVTTEFEVTTMLVGETRIFPPRFRSADGHQYEPPSNVAAFTGSLISLYQRSTAPDGTAVVGITELQFSPGTTSAVFSGAQITTNSIPGDTEVSAPFGMLPIKVIDPSAIASLQINGEPDDHLNLVVGGVDKALDLFPFDADGRLVVGAGPEPTVIIGDPSLLELQHKDVYPVPPVTPINMRRLFVRALDVGTTTLEIKWGPIAKVYTVSITSFGE